MGTTTKQVVAREALLAREPAQIDQTSASRKLAALNVAQAAAGVEAALETLGRALREDAQLRVHGAVQLLKRGLVDGEERVEALLARVPGLGPWIAMGMFRATHADTKADDMPIWPTNFEERDRQSVADYLECIGFHPA